MKKYTNHYDDFFEKLSEKYNNNNLYNIKRRLLIIISIIIFVGIIVCVFLSVYLPYKDKNTEKSTAKSVEYSNNTESLKEYHIDNVTYKLPTSFEEHDETNYGEDGTIKRVYCYKSSNVNIIYSPAYIGTKISVHDDMQVDGAISGIESNGGKVLSYDKIFVGDNIPALYLESENKEGINSFSLLFNTRDGGMLISFYNVNSKDEVKEVYNNFKDTISFDD